MDGNSVADVVNVTRFSRLPRVAFPHSQPKLADLEEESLAILAEIMSLLARGLDSGLSGKDVARLRRAQERITILSFWTDHLTARQPTAIDPL
jgi:hypothetical protein